MKLKFFTVLLLLSSLFALYSCNDKNGKKDDSDSPSPEASKTDSSYNITCMVPTDSSKPGTYSLSISETCGNEKITLRTDMLNTSMGGTNIFIYESYQRYENVREALSKTSYCEYLGLYSAPTGGVECFNSEGEKTGPRTHNDVYYMRFSVRPYKITYEGIDDPAEFGLPTEIAPGGSIDVTHLPILEKENYIFLGWEACKWNYTEMVTNSKGEIIDRYFHDIQKDMTFTPIYSLDMNVTLTLDYNDGTYRRLNIPQSKASTISNSSLVTKYGDSYPNSTLIGWSFDPEGKEPLDKIKPEGDFTLYAIWEDFRYVCLLDGVYEVRFVKITENSSVTLETPTREGYEFCGWFDNELCTGTPISKTITYEDPYYCYYALWKEAR